MRRIEVQLYRSLTSAGQRHVWTLYPRERNLVPHEAGWASGPAWTGAESLKHTGIRIPNRPAHGESLRSKRTADSDLGLSVNCVCDGFS
jgi:hypothetical protein